MSGSILFEAVAFLIGAIVCVSIAKRLGFSSVLGYLFAGMVIGPYVLGVVGEEGEDILHFAEFGVVMMLFLIGLEIEPGNFWKMRKPILGMGGAQVVITTLLSFLLFLAIGFDWNVSLTFSMAVALSSTAISLQTIKEKGLFETTYGASSFAILLFQDIIVIFMLGVLPLLASSEEVSKADGHGGEASLLEHLPLWLQTLSIPLAVILVIAAGQYLIVPMLRQVAMTRVRELLTASSLLIVLGITLLMELVGLSPALGAFLGGVVLANSEFKHELESTLEPFKGLLLGLFFMAVGASINFIVIGNNPVLVGSLLVGVVLLKAVILFGVGAIFKMQLDQRILLAVGLAQIGEFAFVLLSFAFQLHILDREQMDIMLVVTALTMAISPILGIMTERMVLPRIGTKESEIRPIDHIAKTHKIILVGFGHFGSTIGRLLRAYGIEATILDHDSNRVDLLRRMGFEVHYGDATRIDLLESAGIEDARMLIIALQDLDTIIELVNIVQKKYPQLKLMVRAKDRYDAYELLNMGVENVYRQSIDTSVRLAGDVLHHMGFRKYTIHRQAQKFIKSDEEGLRRLASQPTNEEDYIFKVREEIALQERLLEEDLKKGFIEVDGHWESELLRMAHDVDPNEEN